MRKYIGNKLPDVVFKTRVRDESIEGDNPYRWEDVRSSELFANKRVLIFSLPGAFTPTCDTYQLPEYERMYDEFKDQGIDEIYCISVNDAFVMNAWAKTQNLKNVKVLPDGSGHFTRAMNMLVDKDNLGFGYRSWRYAVVADDNIIEDFVPEFIDNGPNSHNNCDSDPYDMTSPSFMIDVVRSINHENLAS